MLRTMNDAQERAIMSEDRNLLILAGPGSGKTFVLTRRLKYLIEEKQVNPEQILTITFTKKAAIEMKDRALAICSFAANVHFGTFHSIFLQIIKNHVKYQNLRLITFTEQKQILSEILYTHHFDSDEILHMLQHFLSEISYLKNLGISSKHYNSKVLPSEQFQIIYKSYNQEIHKRGLLDFDDMLLFCYDLLKNDKNELLRWQKQFEYILIDEFQDINGVQYAIIKLLKGENNSFFAVGDDDQSIYGFRGSNPKFMQLYMEEFYNVKRILLNVNYRSNAEIVALSGRFIAKNTNRFEKNITHSHKEGEGIVCKYFETKRMEEAYLIENIAKIIKLNPSHKVAILFRTSKQGNDVAKLLEREKIKFNREEKNELLYEMESVIEVIAYFKLATGIKMRNDFILIMNKPNRYIHRNSLQNKIIDKNELLNMYYNQPVIQEKIIQLFQDLEFLKKCDPYSGYTYIMHKMGYVRYLKQKYGDNKQKYGEILEVQKEFANRCKAFKNIKNLLEHIDNYMEQNKENTRKTEDSNVYLMTYHASKGLEFEHVFLPFLTKEQVPHKRATTPEQLSEERRVFYVAMTRAKQSLYLSAHSCGNKEMDISPYMNEIKNELSNKK